MRAKPIVASRITARQRIQSGVATYFTVFNKVEYSSAKSVLYGHRLRARCGSASFASPLGRLKTIVIVLFCQSRR